MGERLPWEGHGRQLNGNGRRWEGNRRQVLQVCGVPGNVPYTALGRISTRSLWGTSVADCLLGCTERPAMMEWCVSTASGRALDKALHRTKSKGPLKNT